MPTVGSSRNEHLRLVEDGLRQPRSLPVALGQLADERLSVVTQLDAFDDDVNALLEVVSTNAAYSAEKRQVVLDGHISVEGHSLRQVADVPPRFQGSGHRVVPGDAGRPSGRRQVAGENAHGRSLAGAVGPQKTDDLALLDVERNIVNGEVVAVVLAEAIDLYHRFRHDHP